MTTISCESEPSASVSASPKNRRCTVCHVSFPESDEFFHRDNRTGGFYARCRACHNSARRRTGRKERGSDGLTGGVLQVQRVVKSLYRHIDPDGTEQNQLMRKLREIVKRFQGLHYERRADAASFLMRELLRPEGIAEEGAARERAEGLQPTSAKENRE